MNKQNIEHVDKCKELPTVPSSIKCPNGLHIRIKCQDFHLRTSLLDKNIDRKKYNQQKDWS